MALDSQLALDSQEVLDGLRRRTAFRERVLLPFEVFGSAKELKFPKTESEYMKRRFPPFPPFYNSDDADPYRQDPNNYDGADR